MPTVSAEAFSLVLEDFARERGVGATKRIVVVLDSAGFHVANDVRVPEGVHLVYQPPYSPEVQPSERLWTLVDEPIANRAFESIDELEDILADRCRLLASSPLLIKARSHFAWWPDDTGASVEGVN
jgi:transposase